MLSSALRPMPTASSLGRAISTSTGLGGDGVADADMIMMTEALDLDTVAVAMYAGRLWAV